MGMEDFIKIENDVLGWWQVEAWRILHKCEREISRHNGSMELELNLFEIDWKIASHD